MRRLILRLAEGYSHVCGCYAYKLTFGVVHNGVYNWRGIETNEYCCPKELAEGLRQAADWLDKPTGQIEDLRRESAP